MSRTSNVLQKRNEKCWGAEDKRNTVNAATGWVSFCDGCMRAAAKNPIKAKMRRERLAGEVQRFFSTVRFAWGIWLKWHLIRAEVDYGIYASRREIT